MSTFKRISTDHKQQAVDILSTLLRFRTVGDYPKAYHEAINYLDKTARQMGMSPQIVSPSSDRPALIIRFDGQSKETLLLLSHLDVAPIIEANRWQYPPFSGCLAQGAVWGRGAVDCKGLVVVWLTILRWLREHKKKLKTSIILLVTTDEESGQGDSIRWLIERLSVNYRISCALNEGGGYPVQFGRKHFLTCQVGEKGHSRLRTTELDAIPKNLRAIKNPKTIHFFQPLSAVSRHLVKILLSPRFSHFDPRLLEKILSWQQRNSPQRLDLIELFCHQVTIYSDRGSVKLDLRLLPEDTLQSVEINHKNLLNRLQLQNCQWMLHNYYPSTLSPIHHSLYQRIASALKFICPHFGLIPHITPGYSDSRILRLMGIPVFGFFPLPMGTPITNIHSKNEYLKVSDLYKASEILLEIILQVTTHKTLYLL